MATPGSSQVKIAQKTWEMANNIMEVSAEDEIYKYDHQHQQSLLAAKPWEKDPHFFKDIRISALALLKMVMHARSGGNLEIMGLLLGKVDANVMVVMDCFALPVEGTETRVNAQAQANEYMAAYIESAKNVGRFENAIGWYHSHPGYGCWLSGIDVSTQMEHQLYEDPFVAIVIDPIRTISAGKVNIGAFRTYQKGYKPPDEEQSEYQTIPLNKIEDFGVHCKQYYSLDVSYFKSNLDKIFDLADKLETWDNTQGRVWLGAPQDGSDKKSDDKLSKATTDSCKIITEVLNGMLGQIIKDRIFNKVSCKQITAAEPEKPAAS